LATITTARQAIKFFYKDDPALLPDVDVMVAKLGAQWNRTQGSAPPERFKELMIAAEREIKDRVAQSRVPIPCKAGCDHCCRFPEIRISATEAVLVVRHIEQIMTPEDKAAFMASVQQSGTTGAGRNTACALLGSAGCTVYPSRPLACRSYNSLSVADCQRYRESGGQTPEILRTAVVVDSAAREVSRIYRHAKTYEMNALLRRIFSDPNKVARWLDGSPDDEPDLVLR